MKRYLLSTSFLLALLYSSCKQEETVTRSNAVMLQQEVKQSEAFASTLNEAYQQLPAFVQYYKAASDEDYDFTSQNIFIASSGLPREANFAAWAKQHTVNDAVTLCKNFIAVHQDHPYIDVFKQYSGWLLITRYKMLSPGSEQNGNHLDYLVQNLVDARYKGYNLLYQCFRYMGDNKIKTDSEVKALSSTVVSYAHALDRKAEHPENAAVPPPAGKPVDPRMQALIDNYNEQVSLNKAFIAQLKQL